MRSRTKKMVRAHARSLGSVLAALLGAGAALHCSSSRDPLTVSHDAGAPETSTAAADAIAPADDAVAPADCGEENKQIYVLSSGQRALYRFDPASLEFTRVGDVVCPTNADTFSMAVDRAGNAWVEFTDGRLFSVSTKDAHCTELPFKSTQPAFSRFGMGFAKDDSPTGETLFVEGEALGRIDTKTFDLTLVGPGIGLAELTGTGNGFLYAFDVSSGRVVRLDKTTGDVQQVYRSGAIDSNAAWAFAQWGGSFWLFTGRSTSSVTKFDPANGTSTVVVPDAGFLIVGAGSSTCAPYEPPR